jgi:CheY-like chemotaxis protein
MAGDDTRGQDGGVPSDRPLRVLVADNDPDALELAVTDLRLEGHEIVAQCLDGTSAVERTLALRPDVLVVDHRMPPGLSGAEVAERLHRDGSSVRVIVYSNYRDRAVVERVVAAGATFLPKGSLRALRRAVSG